VTFAIDLYTDAAGFCAFDPTVAGDAAWLHEVSHENGVVILVTVDEPALLDRTHLLSETLDTKVTQFPCPSGQILICAAEHHPSYQPTSGEPDQCLRIDVPPGTHQLNVFHLTWAETAPPEAFHVEDVLNGFAGILALLGALTFLISIPILIVLLLIQALESLTSWFLIQALGSWTRLSLVSLFGSLIVLGIGVMIGNWYERIGRVKQRREATAKFRLTRPKFWLHLETKNSEPHATP
jgi:hypothetical protein